MGMTREELVNCRSYKVADAAVEYYNKHPDADLIDAFEAGADWADEHPAWIRVEDELPEEGDTVLVTLKNRIMTITTTSYCIDGEWYDNDYKINGIVTHWMPKPKPPKKGE